MGGKKRRCKVLTAVFSAVRLWGQVHIHKQMFKQYTHNSCPLLNGSWMWYCSCHSSHVMSVSHSAGTLRKLLCTPDTLQSNAHGKRCTKVMQAPSVLFFFLFFLLPPHTHTRTETDTHAHTQWDKSWGNGCPCFVGPPVHPGYKSEDPVRVNPLCGREPGSCVCVCVCVYICVCACVCAHARVSAGTALSETCPMSGRLAQAVRLGGNRAHCWTTTPEKHTTHTHTRT